MVMNEEPYSLHLFKDTSNANERRFIKGSKYMSGSEIFKIVRHLNFALRINESNPFNEDYYFVTCKYHSKTPTDNKLFFEETENKTDILSELFHIKEVGLANFSKSNARTYFPRSQVAAMTMTEYNTNRMNSKKESSSKYQKIIEQWKQNTGSLGLIAKSSQTKPKPVLDIDVSELDSGEPEQVLWKLRYKINELFRNILQLEDSTIKINDYLSDISKGIAVDISEMKLIEVAHVKLCDTLGETMGFSSLVEEKLSISRSTLKSIIRLEKGRVAFQRAVDFLLPSHLELLFYAICEELIFFVYSGNSELDINTGLKLAAHSKNLSLNQVNKCLGKVLKGLTPAKLKFLLKNEGGKEFIPELLVHGQHLSETEDVREKTKKKWEQLFDEFLKVAKE